MKKNSFLLFCIWLMAYVPTLAVNIKVSDQHPTFIALRGSIDTVYFGSGNQEYVFKEKGRFLHIRAKHPGTSKTNITIFYIDNEGKKNERLNAFYGTISYDAAIQPMYDLTNDNIKGIESSEKSDIEEPLTELLTEALAYLEKAPQTIRRFSQTKQKVSCTLVNAMSTGDAIILKFVLENRSPYSYKLGKSYFLVNQKEKTPIPIILKPKRVVVEPGHTECMTFVLEYKADKSGMLIRFEEKQGRRDLSINLSSNLLTNLPCFREEAK
ncbi:exported protein of unknown function (plasmid) [Cardinium endosymbiont cEper1 of Encarsia pergandiella]|uniref:hypothetical protein n=1 Tax=Cardinium endosymbiont of Encarsia pergandiella TaxID=249402 RepID=UPI00027E9D27|nr:hypothetical protein [Cardinium endosymbiont of Encarsia pergandiella]CCM10640.1 exported protein of unknown function [Cardinium endosymbiont cEper1 of Encarsia pergandiella]